MRDDAVAIVVKDIEKRLKNCPRCSERQLLNEIFIKKKVWGGKKSDENIATLCPCCDEEWRRYVERSFSQDHPLEELKITFERFVNGEIKISQPAVSRYLWALKYLGAERTMVALQKVRLEGGFRARGKRLDEHYPLHESIKLAKLMKKGEKWKDFLMRHIAELLLFKSTADLELKSLLPYFSIWNLYLKHIPGIGPYLGAFLIGAFGSFEGHWCPHVEPGGKYKCAICSKKERIISRLGIRAFPTVSSDLIGYVGMGVDNETGKAERKKRGEKLDYDPFLKVIIGTYIPMCLERQKARAEWSPYSKLFEKFKKWEIEKAINANPHSCYIESCKSSNIVNLGWKCQKADCEFTALFEQKNLAFEHQNKGAAHKIVFAGYCCEETLKSKKPHKFFNPAHIQQRVYRKVGLTFLKDFAYVWLWILGDNNRVSKNARIMAILAMNENGNGEKRKEAWKDEVK